MKHDPVASPQGRPRTRRTNPVGVDEAEVTKAASSAALSEGLLVLGALALVHTVGRGLAVDDTLVEAALAVATADADTVDNVSLLGLEAEAVGLLGAGRTGEADKTLLLPVKFISAEFCSRVSCRFFPTEANPDYLHECLASSPRRGRGGCSA